MTSKEFVNVLESHIVSMKRTQKQFNKLRKDLEVLEIIKKHIINDRVAYLGWEDLEKNEYEKVKEWLENV